jgi:hypothetical protein
MRVLCFNPGGVGSMGWPHTRVARFAGNPSLNSLAPSGHPFDELWFVDCYAIYIGQKMNCVHGRGMKKEMSVAILDCGDSAPLFVSEPASARIETILTSVEALVQAARP